jgi:quinate/shikimate dehydrogenase
MNITGYTKQLCLIGNPVAHSLSPAMHNEACRLLNLDYVYTAFQVYDDDFPRAIEGLKAMHVCGFNVTMPGKRIVANLVDEISREAALSASVNTVLPKDGKLYGYSTDGYGFMQSMRDAGRDLKGEKLSVLGMGGAATAICVQAALDGVSEIVIFRRKNAKWQKALSFADHLQEETGVSVKVADINDSALLKKHSLESSVLVNATSAGMKPHEDELPIKDLSILRKDLFVFDVIYNPMETAFYHAAKEIGAPVLNGIPMLINQGAKAFEYFTGHQMPVKEVTRAVFPDYYKEG